ncbi:MAG: thioredoxin-like domain-containing protein [Actinomycetota bacterium]
MTSPPLPWENLRGRVVIVVFWSFGCEASLLRMRQMQDLEAGAGPGVVVLGVHTPRFPYEENVEEVRAAMAQHRITTYCVHDPGYTTWNRYNPGGWPATVVIDGRGRVLGSLDGTDGLDTLMQSVGLGLQQAQNMYEIGEEPPALPTISPFAPPPFDLAFPEAVTVRAGGELVVADSAHNRLLLFELDDAVRTATATAEIDGFDHPSAVVADDGEGIYVAEQRAGAISYLDLGARQRRLLADDFVRPTGLTIDIDGSLVVADGGRDKLYRVIKHNAETVTTGLIAGSGNSGSADGDAAVADLAQPTGIARTEAGLVFCDAASSNLRLLTDRGRVATITGNGFFEWGLVDGPAHKAMLQRPSALTVLDDGSIVIVDTGNSRLRRLANRRIRTLGLAGLNRPAGSCLLPSGHILVADTGNHRIVVVEPDLHNAWTLELAGVLPPRTPEELAAAQGR